MCIRDSVGTHRARSVPSTQVAIYSAANSVKAKKIIQRRWPHITVCARAAHMWDLYLEDFFNLPETKNMFDKVIRGCEVHCYKETQQLGMYRQSETRAGKHRRHTRTRNASLPTQAHHTARGARKQPPNQGAVQAASEDTTHTSHHTACHQCARSR